MKANNVVVIPLQRYNELLDIETRVDVVVERICHESFLSSEDVLWMLGTELAIDKAMEMQKCRKELLHESNNKITDLE